MKRVIKTQKDNVYEGKNFSEFYNKYSDPNQGSIYNLIVIMRFLEQEGWDFSKTGDEVLPLKLRGRRNTTKYLMMDEKGNEYYL